MQEAAGGVKWIAQIASASSEAIDTNRFLATAELPQLWLTGGGL
jgi:hypothetical protein